MQSGKRALSHEPTRSVAGREAAVWFEEGQAVIVERRPGFEESVELLHRRPGETDRQFEARTVDEVVDEDRVVISGPADARLEFERAYVAATHRPDRLVDVRPTSPTSRSRRQTI